MTVAGPSPFRAAHLVNGALLLLLAGLVAALLVWQWPAIEWRALAATRWIAAGATVFGWLLLVVCFRLRTRRVPTPLSSLAEIRPQWLVLHASQTGFGERLAWQTANALHGAGRTVQVRALADLSPASLRQADQLLLVASTTGEGNAPDPVAEFEYRHMAAAAALHGVKYALLALGDRQYSQFCAFGRRVDHWLRDSGAEALFDTIEVDNGAPDALREWQHRLGVLAGTGQQPDWDAPHYERWRLVRRCLLNPGSQGGPCYHLELQPRNSQAVGWQAGDIAEIGPRNPPEEVQALLDMLALDGAVEVDTARGRASLHECLSRSHLPEPSALPAGLDARELVARLDVLPHREYSIASIPQDGRVHLLVRQLRGPDGRLGIGSAWLTEAADIGDDIDLRIRSNNNFRIPRDERPLVFIGNGTGIAGLRALLKARVLAGRRDNWLLFGERNAATDNFYHDDIAQWQRDGFLARLDLVFSRDGAAHGYVQHRLQAQARRLAQWVARGASLYVCGSQHGMASGVDAVLRDRLGDKQVEQLLRDGRYRRDVY